MCAIVGSKNVNTIKKLIELNSYRGSHSFSFSLFNLYTGHLHVIERRLGSINLDNINIPHNSYGIVHVQAPTTDARDTNSIHPAMPLEGNVSKEFPSYALWHNGIIKQDTINNYSEQYNTGWDTLIMLNEVSKGWDTLNNFDGTFSCLLYDGRDYSLKLFRNEISPMFIDSEMNISSTRFEGSVETTPNVVWKMNLYDNELIDVGSFDTVENPYFFGE